MSSWRIHWQQEVCLPLYVRGTGEATKGCVCVGRAERENPQQLAHIVQNQLLKLSNKRKVFTITAYKSAEWDFCLILLPSWDHHPGLEEMFPPTHTPSVSWNMESSRRKGCFTAKNVSEFTNRAFLSKLIVHTAVFLAEKRAWMKNYCDHFCHQYNLHNHGQKCFSSISLLRWKFLSILRVAWKAVWLSEKVRFSATDTCHGHTKIKWSTLKEMHGTALFSQGSLIQLLVFFRDGEEFKKMLLLWRWNSVQTHAQSRT